MSEPIEPAPALLRVRPPCVRPLPCMWGRLRRILSGGLILPMLVLAACAETRPVQPPVLRAAASLVAPDRQVIEVVVADIPPGVTIERVVLAGPGGVEVPAHDLRPEVTVSGSGRVARPGIGIGATGGSSSGIKPFLSLGVELFGFQGRAIESRRLVGRIRLPDPALYDAEPGAWEIAVHYSDVAGAPRMLTLPAPRPGQSRVKDRSS